MSGKPGPERTLFAWLFRQAIPMTRTFHTTPTALLVLAATAFCPSSLLAAQTLTPVAALGKLIFFDTALSASGRQSCATCHVPSRSFTADPATDHGLPVPLGGANMDKPGFLSLIHI